ncbi:MAG: HAMP domain-containing protein [Candidatus Omnitrophota bacterium]
MNKRPFFWRRKILIQKSLQLKYTALVLITIVVVCGIIVWTVYLTHWALISENPSLIANHAMFADIFQRINKLLLLELPVVLIFAAYASILLSHKVAGPVYRLEKVAYEVAKGDLSQHVQFRKHDELKNLASAFNTVIENIQHLVVKDKRLINELSDLTDRLYVDIKNKKINEDEALTLIRRLNDLVGELRALIMQYKIEKG